MTTEREYQQLHDRIATLRGTVTNQLASELVENPQLAEVLTNQIDELLSAVIDAEMQKPSTPDKGLAQLVGVGDEAADQLGDTRITFGVTPFDENIASERLVAVGDLYYIYHHEKIGIFRVMLKLQELFRAGVVRLFSGKGAFGLYQYDRRQVLRHTARDRMQAYRRVFGYTQATPPPGAQPNRDFHSLFINFIAQVARYYRDKRISEVIRPQSDRHSFGSIAVVRRAGLDLRNNLKDASYGHVNVLRVEVLQLLDEAFRILGEPDIRRLFGADNAWDVVEEVYRRYLNLPRINISQRNRMAIAGRDVLRWLAQPHILNASRAEFEALLTEIADEAEEWLTSAEALGMMPRHATARQYGAGRRAEEYEWEAAE
ncbi:MAG: hypothetical protein KJZ93_15585 [Caldilineaceae bacterium]|nr:hypothetical protein [Caldilineaceae bacterium]